MEASIVNGEDTEDEADRNSQEAEKTMLHQKLTGYLSNALARRSGAFWLLGWRDALSPELTPSLY